MCAKNPHDQFRTIRVSDKRKARDPERHRSIKSHRLMPRSRVGKGDGREKVAFRATPNARATNDCEYI